MLFIMVRRWDIKKKYIYNKGDEQNEVIYVSDESSLLLETIDWYWSGQVSQETIHSIEKLS